ncbi:MAG: ABC transporter permease [Deltaproteobacteria bacterium]|nr:ABC transporter permease [Deltaproteobacteria bacterium]
MDLRNYVLRRLFLAIPTILGVITIVFFLSHIIPGDPVDFIVGDQASSLDRADLIQQLGLDKPLPTQYKNYLVRLFHGDLGTSYYTQGKKVFSLILERLPATILLAFSSLFLALLISIPLGVLSAVKAFSKIDTFAMMLALLGISIPNFALGPLLISIFAVWMNLPFPISGMEGLLSLILPTITLGTALTAILTRMLRTSLLDVLSQDYIRTAYAKGLYSKTILYKHALRNALNPVITITGLQLGTLLTGAIITEKIFDWPGLGQLFIGAIQQRDFLVIQGCVLIISLTYIFINLITDLFYSVVDPTISLK